MRKLLLFTAVLMVALGGSAVSMTLDEAIGLFSDSDIMITYTAEGQAQLEEAIDAFRTALGVTDTLDEANEDALMAFDVDANLMYLIPMLAQCYYTLADAFLGEDEATVKPFYLRGKHWGLKVLRMDPEFAATEQANGFVAAVNGSDNLTGLYWTSSNWLRAGQFDVLAAVFAGMPEKTEAITLRCMELDETYTHYGAYRALGAFWSGLPSLPAGKFRKNWDSSLSHFCKIVDEPALCGACNGCTDFGAIDPEVHEYLENRMFFVEFYLMERGLWADAKRVIDSVVADGIGEKYLLYNAISLEKAAIFLAEVESHL
ncbi:TRAP transporter TatT component family protein [Candidatus Bipolaricaulota bacterium]|nr:TRAP transporter TatT component family protein [Candidatus Bipolaricaulota bacterium]